MISARLQHSLIQNANASSPMTESCLPLGHTYHISDCQEDKDQKHTAGTTWHKWGITVPVVCHQVNPSLYKFPWVHHCPASDNFPRPNTKSAAAPPQTQNKAKGYNHFLLLWVPGVRLRMEEVQEIQWKDSLVLSKTWKGLTHRLGGGSFGPPQSGPLCIFRTRFFRPSWMFWKVSWVPWCTHSTKGLCIYGC